MLKRREEKRREEKIKGSLYAVIAILS